MQRKNLICCVPGRKGFLSFLGGRLVYSYRCWVNQFNHFTSRVCAGRYPFRFGMVFFGTRGKFPTPAITRHLKNGCVPHQAIWLAWPPFEVDSSPLFVGDSSTCLSSDHQNNFYRAHSRVSSGNLASSGRSVASEGELKTVYHDSSTK